LNILDKLKANKVPEGFAESKRIQIAQRLTEFPRELFSIADQLEILDLGGNQLSDLPDDFDRFKNLRILFLTDNKFEHIPTVLAKCENLEIIAFKSNRVKIIEEDCLPLSTRWLILTNNQIKSLPNSMGQLTRLKKLALAGNRLSSLPSSMASCKELELVRLSANELLHIPDWLLSLPRLSWLAFSGNPVCKSSNLNPVQIHQVEFDSVKLNHKIGEGASGVIYHAGWAYSQDNTIEKTESIAVKLFKGMVTSDGYPQDEIQCCLKAGEHPNLIEVLSYIEDSEQLGLVMTLISSEYKNLGLPPSLESCTRDIFEVDTSLSSLGALKIAYQMADTLRHMHQQDVSHGDIYAHNTMIDSQNNVLFGDFGAATNLDVLNVEQKTKMLSIEMRAFGCLLDDLLKLIKASDPLTESLKKLSQLAMNEYTSLRPTFIEMRAQLFELQKIHGSSE
jgi:hypothetical protein